MIETKLSVIENDVKEIKKYMVKHIDEHLLINRELAKQELINKGLYFVSGCLFMSVLGLIWKTLFGG